VRLDSLANQCKKELSLRQMSSGANVFEISDIQENEAEAVQ